MKSLVNFRKKVLDALNQLNWSQADLAKRTHIAQPSINVYLSGKKDPNVETCERIADALGVELGALFLNKKVEIQPPHTLDDCMKAIATQIGSAMNFTPNQIDRAVNTPASLSSHDSFIEEAISILNSFDSEQKKKALKSLQSIKKSSF